MDCTCVFKQTEGADLKWLSEQTGQHEDDFFDLKPGDFWEFILWADHA